MSLEAPGSSPPAQAHSLEERFRLLVEHVRDYAIFMLDPEGHVQSWNEGAQRMKGYATAEILGSHFSRFYPPEDVATGKPQRILAKALQDGRVEDEGWRIRKDGTRFWANAVVTALRDDSGELRGFAKITRDLTERRQKEEAERQAMLHQEAGRLKDEFLAVLSHELRTPLNVIVGEVWRLRQGRLDEEQARRAWEALERNVRLQTRIIDDLLDTSRIGSGKISLDMQEVDLHVLVAPLVDELRTSAPAVQVRADLQRAVVQGDPARLQQIVSNLLSNAAKFTPPGGSIEIAVSPEGDNAVVRVTDTGVGIAPAFLPHVFDRFSQADASPRRSHRGLGLGLAIVRQLVELHGGTIDASSAGEGRGSTFQVTLPLAG